jgi:uncharacterized membrane protein
MGKGRFEAFSDGVIAIIITIMVLELKVPHSVELAALKPLIPVFFSYVLSFIYVGIYWNNHHHMLHAVNSVTGPILWANLHLLFWLSLIPFVTGWMGENHMAAVPVALYGVVLMMCAIAFTLLAWMMARHEGADSSLARAIGKNRKTLASTVFNLAGVGLAFVNAWVAVACYVAVAAIWFLPDRRIERELNVS